MTEFKTTLRIDKVGDQAAIASLEQIDVKGRQVVDRVAKQVATATSQAVGSVTTASVYSSRAIGLLELEARKLDATFRQTATGALYSTRAMAVQEIEARKLDAAMRSTGASTSLASQATQRLGLAIGAFAGLALVRSTIALADTYTNLHARLGLVTTSTANLARVQAELLTVSQRTRTDLDSNVSLYSALARSTKTLGLGQSELVTITQAIAQSFKISGASVSETSNATRQLGQAFASGVLRGDEFNSIAENAPRLQKAVADSMGVTIGQLRAMAADGKITGAVIATALLGKADEIAAEFSRMPNTVGGAMTQIHNAMLVAVGATDSATSSTAGLAGALTSLAGAIPGIGKVVNAFFGGLQLQAAQAALGVEQLQLKVASWQLKLADSLGKGGIGASIAAWLREGANKMIAGQADVVAMMEARLQALAVNLTSDGIAQGSLNAGGPKGAPAPDAGAAKKEAARRAKELARDMREATKLVRAQMIDDLTVSHEASSGLLDGLLPDPKSLAKDIAEIGKQIADTIKNSPILNAMDDFTKKVAAQARQMGQAVGSALSGVLTDAFDNLFSGDGDFFKKLGASILSSLGGLMQLLGAQFIVFGELLSAFIKSVATLNPAGQIAAGVAMIAAGAAIKAIAGSFGGGSSGSGSGGGSYSGGSIGSIIDRGIINPAGSYTATRAGDIQARPAITNNNHFYGVNDPQAVRWFDEIQKRSLQRGSLAGG